MEITITVLILIYEPWYLVYYLYHVYEHFIFIVILDVQEVLSNSF